MKGLDDSLLFSLVEDEGFRRLIIDQDIPCQAEDTYMLHQMFHLEYLHRIKGCSKGEIDSVAHVSFTTDGVQASAMNLFSASQLTG